MTTSQRSSPFQFQGGPLPLREWRLNGGPTPDDDKIDVILESDLCFVNLGDYRIDLVPEKIDLLLAQADLDAINFGLNVDGI